MAECKKGMQALSKLCVKSAKKYLMNLIMWYIDFDSSEKSANRLRDAVQSIPPNFHDSFLYSLAQLIDDMCSHEVSQEILNFMDELTLMLLSPSITHIDVEMFKFPTRNPSKYLKALSVAKSLKVFVSRKENIWKYSVSKFNLLSSALIKMPNLIHLTLRHLKISSSDINILLEGLASNSPHLTYLDLKHSAITDPGLEKPTSVEDFRSKCDGVDCIPALLKMKNLRHLNVSESWLSYCGIKAIVQNLKLERLEAIMGDSHDFQAVVIKNLLSVTQEPPFSLPRKTYFIAQKEQNVGSICKACPLLEHVIVQQCPDVNIPSYFSAFEELKHLNKITLCGLEWTLLNPHLDNEPHMISPFVTEVTLQELSCVDAHSLAVLSICFPQITHLWIMGSEQGISDEFWDGGRVFKNLTHLHYQGTLYVGDFGRIDREQGLQNVLDVLLRGCRRLRCLTLYTDELGPFVLLSQAVGWNGLQHLEELRLGLQRHQHLEDSMCGPQDMIMSIIRNAQDLKVFGRTDWLTSMSLESKQGLIRYLKMRYPDLVVFGLDEVSDTSHDPNPYSFHHRHAW